MPYSHSDFFVGTSRLGTVNATYAQLVELHGEPTFKDPHEKSKAEWNVMDDEGGKIAIWDYKDDRPLDCINDWSLWFGSKAAETNFRNALAATAGFPGGW